MSQEPTFSIPPTPGAAETTGRYVVTFSPGATSEGVSALMQETGIRTMVNAADFSDSAMDLAQLDAVGAAVFPTLGIAVVTMEQSAVDQVMTVTGVDFPILAIEPERIFYALSDGLPLDYLKGYRDAINGLYELARGGLPASGILSGEVYADDAQSTWGLKATKVVDSRYTGKGIKVAVLDTGFDFQHPDFAGRSVLSSSFVPGETADDGQGHGTHCIGTSCGFKDLNGRRYGVAYEAIIYVGKVLSNAGSGYTSWILAGIEWAISNKCQVISMSLGNPSPSPSAAYEAVGRRALENGCLIVAAAGNHREQPLPGPNPVGQPANSPSIMAVAAVDRFLGLAKFSATSGSAPGANVDIAGPGVAVYSSVPMNKGRYATWNGTSMATPHVSGIAALWAQARGASDSQLWQLLVSNARRLTLPTADVGAGLVQAPL